MPRNARSAALVLRRSASAGHRDAAADDYPATLKPTARGEMTAHGRPPRRRAAVLDDLLRRRAATEMVDMGSGMRELVPARAACATSARSSITDTECKLRRAAVVKTHAVMTMKATSAYRTEADGHLRPAADGKTCRQAKTIVEAKHIGACRDGLRPGDIVTGAGQKINIRQMQQERAARASSAAAQTPAMPAVDSRTVH